MFTPEERRRIRDGLVEAARVDPRLSGGAVTGSGAAGMEDDWSDIDLAFGVRETVEMSRVLDDWTARMSESHQVVHHVDVRAGSWIYRVFLLANTLQVDLAFAPAADFGARAPTFRLRFGTASELPQAPPPSAESLIGLAWLYALHVRSSLARGRLWQAEHMLSAMRDQVLALACLRHGLPVREARGVDRLPHEVTLPLERALVRRIAAPEIEDAHRAAASALLEEARCVDPALADRLVPVLRELSGSAGS
jgi:hypothetical protein